MKRRNFLVSSSAFAMNAWTASSRALGRVAFAEAGDALDLKLGQPLHRVPQDFVGLSYESQQLSNPGFFSARNTGLIPLFRILSSTGVLRLGGNTSANSWWKASEDDRAPVFPPPHSRGAGIPSEKLQYAITPQAIHDLRGFLDAVDWNCIYGLNLANGTPERAAEEAAFVAKTLGPRLLYLQIGNEADLFSLSVRPVGWTAEEFFAEWLRFARAVHNAVPHAMLSAPDISSKMDWLRRFAELLSKTPDAPKVAAITHHYYVGGPPSNPQITIPNVLAGSPLVQHQAEVTQQAAKLLGAKYRMTEGNTCYQGGKPGVSDVFASTLWAAEYSLTLATDGYAGINLHGGGGQQVADSLGGTLPGEKLLPPGSGWHPRPFYTPIASTPDGGFRAQPVFYGLLLMDYFANCTLLKAEVSSLPDSVSIYAARGESGAREGISTRFVVFNNDPDKNVAVRINAPRGLSILRVEATGLAAQEVTFGGVQVAPDGSLPTPAMEHLKPDVDDMCIVSVPHAQAVLAFLR